jgi:hypothetical protein
MTSYKRKLQTQPLNESYRVVKFYNYINCKIWKQTCLAKILYNHFHIEVLQLNFVKSIINIAKIIRVQNPIQAL